MDMQLMGITIVANTNFIRKPLLGIVMILHVTPVQMVCQSRNVIFIRSVVILLPLTRLCPRDIFAVRSKYALFLFPAIIGGRIWIFSVKC